MRTRSFLLVVSLVLAQPVLLWALPEEPAQDEKYEPTAVIAPLAPAMSQEAASLAVSPAMLDRALSAAAEEDGQDASFTDLPADLSQGLEKLCADNARILQELIAAGAASSDLTPKIRALIETRCQRLSGLFLQP